MPASGRCPRNCGAAEGVEHALEVIGQVAERVACDDCAAPKNLIHVRVLRELDHLGDGFRILRSFAVSSDRFMWSMMKTRFRIALDNPQEVAGAGRRSTSSPECRPCAAGRTNRGAVGEPTGLQRFEVWRTPSMPG